MVSKAEYTSVMAARDEFTGHAQVRGHAMRWQLGENARKVGYAYFWNGQCRHCGAEVSIGSCWSSCRGVRDARAVGCSGAGTHVLTEIEAKHVHRAMHAAVARYATEVAEVIPELAALNSVPARFLLAGDRFAWKGEYYTADDVPCPSDKDGLVVVNVEAGVWNSWIEIPADALVPLHHDDLSENPDDEC